MCLGGNFGESTQIYSEELREEKPSREGKGVRRVDAVKLLS